MTVYKCENCSANLEFNEGDTIVTCKYCGVKQNLQNYLSSESLNKKPLTETSNSQLNKKTNKKRIIPFIFLSLLIIIAILFFLNQTTNQSTNITTNITTNKPANKLPLNEVSTNPIKADEYGTNDKIYEECLILIDNKKYQEALEKLYTISKFKNVADLIIKCETGIKDNTYELAISLKKSQKFEEAIEQFKTIIDYKDSVKQIEECQGGTKYLLYVKASELVNRQQYKEAIKIFDELSDYKDSRSRKSVTQMYYLNTIDKELKELKMEMVFCPANSFYMGFSKKENAAKGSKPVNEYHKVTLTKPFRIGKYEVTQSQYEFIMGKNPSRFKGANNPVEVNMKQASEFCEELNKRYASSLPEGYHFNLPTEAQWEYACRAGTKLLFNNDKNLESIDEVCWYSKNSGYKTHPVGQKKPNVWGIYDMHGNVGEWCRDYYAPYPAEEVIDPLNMEGEEVVVRGGAHGSPRYDCYSASRGSDARGVPNNSGMYGFRLALVPIQE